MHDLLSFKFPYASILLHFLLNSCHQLREERVSCQKKLKQKAILTEFTVSPKDSHSWLDSEVR